MNEHTAVMQPVLLVNDKRMIPSSVRKEEQSASPQSEF